MEYIVSTESMSRKFGKNLAVSEANLHIKKGDIYGIIGRNGAGKTTILKMLCGMLRTSSGTVTLFDETGSDTSVMEGLRRVGALIEAPGLHNSMTAYQNIEMKCICAGIGYDPDYINGLLELVKLSDVRNVAAGKFSLGMRQRLGIALALVGDPELLILDEPINGLDPQGILEVREILMHLHDERGVTIVISSHILEELSKIVTDYAIIEKGVILQEISREALENTCKKKTHISVDNGELALNTLSSAGYVCFAGKTKNDAIVNESYDDVSPIVALLAAAGVKVHSVVAEGQNLEEFFFSIVGGGENE